MHMRPKCVLLDAGPVFELHRQGLWGAVVDQVEIVLPSIVAGREVRYWDAGNGETVEIDLQPEINRRRILVEEVSPAEMAGTLSRFDPSVSGSVDPGELEALTLIASWHWGAPPHFCTADRMAVVALCALGHSELALSLEEFLRRLGIRRNLPRRYTSEAMKSWVAEGAQRAL